MAEHLVVYGGGAQPLRHVPVDRLGRPTRVTSATYTIVDLRESITSAERVIASGSATLDAASTTLAEDAGPAASAYPERLDVASVSGFAEGRTYQLSGADGERETVTSVAIDATNTRVVCRLPVRGNYESGDTLRGIELSCTFPADEANDEDETVKDIGHPGYQVTWSYEIDGRDYLVGELVRVSRYSVQPWIDAHDILIAHPALAKRVQDVEGPLLCATEDILAELEAGGHDPTLVRTGISGKVLLRCRTLYYMMLGLHGDDDRETAARFLQQSKDLLHRILNAGTPPRDVVVLSQSDDTPTKTPFSDLFQRG
jgi:hypothetical protein